MAGIRTPIAAVKIKHANHYTIGRPIKEFLNEFIATNLVKDVHDMIVTVLKMNFPKAKPEKGPEEYALAEIYEK